MWQWIKSLFTEEQQPANLFNPEHRNIYRYWDGREVRQRDPMDLYRRLCARGGDIVSYAKLAVSPSKDAAFGHTKLVEHIREVFEVKPLSEGGLTEGESIDLWIHFLEYSESVKKKPKNSPTSPGGTSPGTPPSPGDPPATKSSSDTGSTGGEDSTGTPTP